MSSPARKRYRGRVAGYRLLALASAAAGVTNAVFAGGSWLLAAVLIVAAVALLVETRLVARDLSTGTTVLPAQGSAATGSLVVRRAGGVYRDRLRAYQVLVDGQTAGGVLAGQQLAVPVMPGEHRVQLGIDWARSNPVSVVVGDGETVDLDAVANGSAWAALYWITLGSRRYIDLRAADQLGRP